jgi:acetate kinase
MQPERRSDGHVILCLNSGSSSLKFSLYQLNGPEETRLAQGAVERIGLSDGHLWIQATDDEDLVDEHRDFPDHTSAVEAMFPAAEQVGFPPPGRRGPSCGPWWPGP